MLGLRVLPEPLSVCHSSNEQMGAVVQPGWRCLEVVGPLDFGMVGVMASITGCLARASVSTFVLFTYDTDYVLVREQDLKMAVTWLARDGYHLSESHIHDD